MSIKHYKDCFTDGEKKYYIDRLIKEVPWKLTEWRPGVNLPRLTFRYDRGLSVDILDDLTDECEEMFGCTVYGLWCNYYRDGKDWTPFHQDNYGTHIITFSFGGERRFITENIEDKKKEEYLLENGDVIYFDSEFDRNHKHSIPKTTKVVDPRVSIVMFATRPGSKSTINNDGIGSSTTGSDGLGDSDSDSVSSDSETDELYKQFRSLILNLAAGRGLI